MAAVGGGDDAAVGGAAGFPVPPQQSLDFPEGRDDSISPLARAAPEPHAGGHEKGQYELLQALGFYSDRRNVKESCDSEFLRLAGSVEDCVSEERFVEYARLKHGISTQAAKACFCAADLDMTGLLNRHEFLVANDAFFHTDAPAHGELMRVRSDAVFFLFADALKADGTAVLTWTGFVRLITELCRSDGHAEAMAKAIVAPAAPGAAETERVDSAAALGQLGLEDFRAFFKGQKFVDGLQRTRLSRSALLKRMFKTAGVGLPTGAVSHVVLDDRQEFARAEDPIDVGRIVSVQVPVEAVNESLHLDPRLRVTTDWRGPFAAERGTDLFRCASNVINEAMAAAHKTFSEEAMSDSEWLVKGEMLAKMLGPTVADRRLSLGLLASSCRVEVARQPTVVRVPQPAKVFGDVHGQLRDLLLLFREFGMPTHRGGDIECVSYVFNGDFVDRGAHQIEVVALMFALKVMYPSRVFLIRGNHEFRCVNEYMDNGFDGAMVDAFGHEVTAELYEVVHECFNYLPLGAVVGERVFVVHGGVGAGDWTIGDLDAIRRPILDYDPALDADKAAIREASVVMDAVWSDPSDSDAEMRRGVHTSGRGEDVKEFGQDITAKFCESNGIDVVVRSHQYMPCGYKVMHSGHLITVFSARNYFDREDNDSALLLIAEDSEAALRIRPKTLLQAENVAEW